MDYIFIPPLREGAAATPPKHLSLTVQLPSTHLNHTQPPPNPWYNLQSAGHAHQTSASWHVLLAERKSAAFKVSYMSVVWMLRGVEGSVTQTAFTEKKDCQALLINRWQINGSHHKKTMRRQCSEELLDWRSCTFCSCDVFRCHGYIINID